MSNDGMFRVYGISRTNCREQIKKLLKDVYISMSAYSVAVEVMGDELFETQKKKAAISPRFAAPQFCQDWIKVAGSQIKDAVVKVNEETGDYTKKGVPKRRWGVYKARAA